MVSRKLFLLGILAAACGNTPPTNFAGSYALTIVNGDNACQLQNWKAGDSSTNITADITQDSGLAEITIPGNTLAGAFLLLTLGTSTFSGTVTGNELTATYLGTQTQTQNACNYTTKATLDVTLDANSVVSGTITYTPQTNGDASCGVLNTCSYSQTVSGTRTSQ